MHMKEKKWWVKVDPASAVRRSYPLFKAAKFPRSQLIRPPLITTRRCAHYREPQSAMFAHQFSSDVLRAIAHETMTGPVVFVNFTTRMQSIVQSAVSSSDVITARNNFNRTHFYRGTAFPVRTGNFATCRVSHDCATASWRWFCVKSKNTSEKM